MENLDEGELNLSMLDTMLENSLGSKSNALNAIDTVVYLEKLCERLNQVEQMCLHSRQALKNRQIEETQPIIKRCLQKNEELDVKLNQTKVEEAEIREDIELLAERTEIAKSTVRASIGLAMSDDKIREGKAALERVKERKRNTAKVYEACIMSRLRIQNQINNLMILMEELQKLVDEDRDYKLMQQQMTAGCFQVSFEKEIRENFLSEITRLRRNRRVVRQYNQKLVQLKKARGDLRNKIAHLVSSSWR